MNRFKNKRGVILPHTHAIRKALVEGLSAEGHGDRIITHDSNGLARQTALNKFFESERDDLVLISTYVGEGFDFKGKLAEWLVISKVPYLFTPDPHRSRPEWNRTNTNGGDSTKARLTVRMNRHQNTPTDSVAHSLVINRVKAGSISRRL